MTAFDSLLGQAPAVELLTQALHRNRIAPAYLFVGPPGVGRTLAAACFIELLLSREGDTVARLQRVRQRNHPDLLWVEPTYLHQGKRLTAAEAEAAGLKRKAPPQIRLEQIREMTQFLSRPPLEADRAVVVLEQAETMAEAAANALLKTLEEPGRATLILIAPTLDSLLPTLVSRCQRIPFYRLSPEILAEVLQRAGSPEILHQPQILDMAQGSPGAAIAHWQQYQAIPAELLQALTEHPRSLRQALTLGRQIAKELEAEAQLWLIDYLQHCYWQQAPGLARPLLQRLEQAKQYLLAYAQPQLVWEVTLMGMVS